MLKTSYPILFCFLVLFGCTFAPKDKYVNPISPPPSSIKVSVDIQDPNFKDPFNLNAVTTFNFRIDSTTKPILDYQVLLDGAPVQGATLSNMLVSFTLSPGLLSDGNHPVKILIKIDPKSGSLANHLGVEYYPVEKDFTVVVDKTSPIYSGGPIVFTIENGFLTLTWSKINKNNFAYFIQSNLSGDTLITDPTINKFVDRGYVGGKITYSIFSVVLNGAPSPLVSGSYYVHPITLKVSATTDGIESFSWSNSKLNTANVSITMQGESSSITTQGASWSKTVPVSQDTLLGIKPIMGDADRVNISIKRKGYPSYSYDTSVVYTPSRNFPKFSTFQATESKKLFINFTSLTRINLENLTKEDSIPYPSNPTSVAVSGDGNEGVIYSTVYFALYKFDPNDFTAPHGNYFLNYNGPYKGGQVNISTSYAIDNSSTISNTNLGGINYLIYMDPINYFDQRKTSGIWDFSSGKAVWADTTNNDTPVISSDGNYFVVNNHGGTENWVYRNNAGSWSFIGKVPLGSRIFRNHGTTELILITSLSVTIFDLAQSPDINNNFNAVRTFPIDQAPAPNTTAYDPASESVYFEYLGSSVIYNYTMTQSTIKVYGVQSFDYKGSGVALVGGYHYYSNGYHFLSTGYAEKIK